MMVPVMEEPFLDSLAETTSAIVELYFSTWSYITLTLSNTSIVGLLKTKANGAGFRHILHFILQRSYNDAVFHPTAYLDIVLNELNHLLPKLVVSALLKACSLVSIQTWPDFKKLTIAIFGRHPVNISQLSRRSRRVMRIL